MPGEWYRSWTSDAWMANLKIFERDTMDIYPKRRSSEPDDGRVERATWCCTPSSSGQDPVIAKPYEQRGSG